MASLPMIYCDPLHKKFVEMCSKNTEVKQKALELADENRLVVIKTNQNSSMSWCYSNEALEILYKALGV